MFLNIIKVVNSPNNSSELKIFTNKRDGNGTNRGLKEERNIIFYFDIYVVLYRVQTTEE